MLDYPNRKKETVYQNSYNNEILEHINSKEVEGVEDETTDLLDRLRKRIKLRQDNIAA